MYFLRNRVNILKTPLNNARNLSNCNNRCQFDIDSEKRIKLMFAMSPQLYVLSICNLLLTVVSIFAK